MKLHASALYLTLLITALSCGDLIAQESKDTSACTVRDLGDLISKKEKKEKPPKNHYIIATPVVGSSPANGFIVGVAGQMTFKGKDPEDKYSLVNANMQFTSKNQSLFQAKNNLLLANNKLFMSGDFRVFLYSQPTYGLGTNALNEAEGGGLILGNEAVEPDSVAQDMDYNYFKFHQMAAYNFKGIFYIGGGINIDIYDKIEVLYPLSNYADTSFHTSYSLEHEFDTTDYTLNALSVNGIIDTRDNQLNATKGIFLNMSYQFGFKLTKQQKTSSIISGELRYFKSFRAKKHMQTVGLWIQATIIAGGEAPYLILPASGWDQRSRGGRGYPQGTFRGESFSYAEVEYRFPITCDEVIGGVLFANLTSASDRSDDVPMFRYIQPGFGAGLRFMLDKTSRTNLVADYGFGRKSHGFYINAGETF